MSGFQEGFNNASLALDATRQGIEYGQHQQDRQMALGEHQDAQKHQKMAQLAAYIVAAPAQMRPQLWQQIAPQFNAEGLPVPPQWDDGLLPLAQQYAQAWGVKQDGLDALKPMNVSPGGEIVDPSTGRVIHSNSNFAPSKPVWDSARGGWVMPVDGQPQQPPQGQRVQFDFAPGTPQSVMDATRAYAGADGGAPAQGVGGGGYGGGSPGFIPVVPPKDSAPADFERKAAYLRARGVPEDRITQMVLGGSESAPASLGDTTKTGPAYLASLKPNEAAQVRALADGRMAFPSGTALKSPHWQAMLEAVSQYDPNFDAVNYNARSKTRNAFVAGKEGQTINSLNTVAEHLGQFSDNAKALGNFDTPILNRVKNTYLEQTGDPRISAFNTNRKAVADEVAKVWRASGGSEADIQENLKNLDGAQSPAQLNAAIGTLTELIYGKINALQDQYNSGMGTTQNPRPLVSPKAQAAFDKTLARQRGDEPAAKKEYTWNPKTGKLE